MIGSFRVRPCDIRPPRWRSVALAAVVWMVVALGAFLSASAPVPASPGVDPGAGIPRPTGLASPSRSADPTGPAALADLTASGVAAPEDSAASDDSGTPASGSAAVSQVYQVLAGDSLWLVAEACLGDPHRWEEIYLLNRGLPQADGQALTDPDVLGVGWVLLLPGPAEVVTPSPASTPSQESPTQPAGSESAQSAPSPPQAEAGSADGASGRVSGPWTWLAIWFCVLLGLGTALLLGAVVSRRRSRRPGPEGSHAVFATLAVDRDGHPVERVLVHLHPRAESTVPIDRIRADVGAAREALRQDSGDAVIRFAVLDTPGGRYLFDDPASAETALWRLVASGTGEPPAGALRPLAPDDLPNDLVDNLVDTPLDGPVEEVAPESAGSPEDEPSRLPALPSGAVPASRPTTLAGYTAEQLRYLGIPERLIGPALAATGGEEELDRLVEREPDLVRDIMYGLALGMSVEEVRDEVIAPVRLAPGLRAAGLLVRARSRVTSVDSSIRLALSGDFQDWRIFLHPSHEHMVQRHYNGPTRVYGGPGTGRTVVALRRVTHLVTRLPIGRDRPVLLVTSVPDLVSDLRDRLARLVGPDLLARVEIAHIDEVADEIRGHAGPGRRNGLPRRVDDAVVLDVLRRVVAESEDTRWSAEFLFDEWDQVICDQDVSGLGAYLAASRSGRGPRLTRAERGEVWTLIRRFVSLLDELGIESAAQRAERAAAQEASRIARLVARRARRNPARDRRAAPGQGGPSSGSLTLQQLHQYRHIVVDAAHEFRPAHWRLLRTLVDPEAPNSLFIVGDNPDRQLSLGTLGINVRGRSHRLTPSYRTTWDILTKALLVLEGGSGASASALVGCQSVLRGPAPVLSQYATWQEELDGLATTIARWATEVSVALDGSPRDASGCLAVCVVDESRLAETLRHLAAAVAPVRVDVVTAIGHSASGPVVQVGTTSHLRGREYQRLVIVGVDAGLPARPGPGGEAFRASLFNTMVRARDALAISWHGDPDPCVAALWEQDGC